MTAHEAAVQAMATRHCPERRACGECEDEARTHLAALVASGEVRAALRECAEEVPYSSVVVDAVLAALTPGGATTDDGGA